MFVRQFRIALYKTVKRPITNKWNMAMCDNQYMHVMLSDRKRARAHTLVTQIRESSIENKMSPKKWNEMKSEIFCFCWPRFVVRDFFFSSSDFFVYTTNSLAHIINECSINRNGHVWHFYQWDLNFFAFIWREIVN